MLSYAVVTPARNEAGNLPRLAATLAGQTHRPVAWVIVDNGSTDDTMEVVQRLREGDPTISSISAPGEEVATRGGPVAGAFTAGLEALPAIPDVVVKVDGDVSAEPDYFAGLIAEFEADPSLGIASGTCYELEDGNWVPRHVTAGSVRGASRAYRWACLQDVLPLERRTGWDGIDELKAAGRGWRTTSFAHLPFYHHRVLGGRDHRRRLQPWLLGESAHYTGYRPSYLVLSALFRARRQPSSLAMIGGYASAALRREPRCPDPTVIAHARRQQRIRELPVRIREALGRAS